MAANKIRYITMALKKFSWTGYWPKVEDDSFCCHDDEGPFEFTFWVIALTAEEAREKLSAIFRIVERDLLPKDKQMSELNALMRKRWSHETGSRISALGKELFMLVSGQDDTRHLFDVYGIEHDADKAQVGCIGHKIKYDFADYTLSTVVLDIENQQMNLETLLQKKPNCNEL